MLIEVQTTQNVTIDYEPAGLGNRMLAAIIDYSISIIWLITWFIILVKFKETDIFSILYGMDYTTIIFLSIIIFGPVTFYHLLFEYFNNGQSFGKMLVKIRVVKVDGTRPGFGAILLRWLFRPIDIDFTASFGIPGLIGMISIISTKKSQRLGDMLAGTTVIDLKVDKNSKKLRDIELDFDDNYQVIFLDVLNRLSDKDIQTILSIINDKKLKDADNIIHRLSDRIKLVTGYSYDGENIVFLRKIVNDYNYLSLQ